MENIIMICLGMIIWQAIIFLFILFDKFDYDITQMISCGFWSLLWIIIIKPILYIIKQIHIYFFNKKYFCLSFWRKCSNDLLYCTTFWAKEDVVKELYISNNPEEESDSCVQIIKTKIKRNLPPKSDILTLNELKEGCRGWTSEFFKDFLK